MESHVLLCNSRCCTQIIRQFHFFIVAALFLLSLTQNLVDNLFCTEDQTHFYLFFLKAHDACADKVTWRTRLTFSYRGAMLMFHA